MEADYGPALILGVGGQDGSYLTELLLSQGRNVFGVYRRSSVDNLQRIRHLIPNDRLHLLQGDLTDHQSIEHAMSKAARSSPLNRLDIYNLADQDDVRFSHSTPAQSVDLTAGAVARLLASVRTMRDIGWRVRLFQPVSSTVFWIPHSPLLGGMDEDYPTDPASPYACAKLHAWNLCKMYRKYEGLEVCCGVMFNHDSPGRGRGYLLRKIVDAVRKYSHPDDAKLREEIPGDWTTIVDIGYAPEYADAMTRIMSLKDPKDYVIATGKGFSIASLIELAYWTQDGTQYEIEHDVGVGRVGDPSRLEHDTGWKATVYGHTLLQIIANGVDCS